MKKSSEKNKWEDHYSRQARKEGYPARSVYKLKEMQEKYRLIKKGSRVLDLGSAPGSWLVFAAQITGGRGQVTGIDLKPVKTRLPDHVRVLTGDILDLSEESQVLIGKNYHVVISDMAPATTGRKDLDAIRSLELCEGAWEIARQTLVPKGSFVCKIFQGEDFKSFSDKVRASFMKYKIFKPKSTRKASREVYMIGMGIKEGV
ncbi:RlmE family RNA methyltransferase [Desulfobacterales bacterium HSG16]|nr:RlmE family RNA methyltransferase [Desulfobacterales bacterium HSG16]